MKIDLNLGFVDSKGDKVGTEKTCYVLENDKKTFVKQDGEFLMAKLVHPADKLTAKEVICRSILVTHPDMKQDEKTKCFKIFRKVDAATKSIELSLEELTLSVKMAYLSEGTIIAGQLEEYMEGGQVVKD